MTQDDSTRPEDQTSDDEQQSDVPETPEIEEASVAESPEPEIDEPVDDEPADDETADDESADEVPADEESADDDEPSARSPFSSIALAAAVTALIVAVLCVGFYGYSGIRAYTVDSATEQLRTESVDAAEQAVLNITTVDPTDGKEWKRRLESSLAGDALKQVDPDSVLKLSDSMAGTGDKAGSVESKIARSAATEVDTDGDTATVLVFANVTSRIPGQEPVEQQLGFILTMVDVDGVRKANKVIALQTIEFTDEGSPVTNAPEADEQGGGN